MGIVPFVPLFTPPNPIRQAEKEGSIPQDTIRQAEREGFIPQILPLEAVHRQAHKITERLERKSKIHYRVWYNGSGGNLRFFFKERGLTGVKKCAKMGL